MDLIAWEEATPGTGTPYVAAALGENSYRSTGDIIELKDNLDLLALFYSAASTPGEVYLEQPKIREPAIARALKGCLNEDLDPLQGFTWFGGKGPKLAKSQTYAISRNATDEATIILAWLARGGYPSCFLPQPFTHVIRGAADQALTALTWTTNTVTWAPALEPTEYIVVGMMFGSYKAANMMLGGARLIMKESEARPGAPLISAEADKTTLASSNFGVFWMPPSPLHKITYNNLPNIEVCSPAVNTDLVAQLYLQKVK